AQGAASCPRTGGLVVLIRDSQTDSGRSVLGLDDLGLLEPGNYGGHGDGQDPCGRTVPRRKRRR
ncbi:MAG: hypothetical protein LC799_17035, partial [Actinobacteria bacterium]|nr:hypothetical protein [Actinomycetota bacterium]